MMKIDKNFVFILFSILFIQGLNAQEPTGSGAVLFQSAIQKLADGFQFTEGPAADKAGNVFFTDIPNSRIHKWSIEDELSIFLENSDGANGLFFDKKGDLIACAGGAGQVVSIDPKGLVTVLADQYKGEPFNSPNDLWLTPKGGIYFTDPRYGNRENLPQGGEHVYYLSADRKRLIRVIDDMVRPNGLIGTPDGKKLYVADHGAGKTYAYKINADGTLSDKKLFADQGSDGMTLDAAGNLYLTAAAVNIYSSDGMPIQTIKVPERPSNVCFGGKDRRTLFITARKSVYGVRMQNNLYSFTMTDIDGKPVPLSDYQGKVLLIVNVASRCGFTKQYAGLEQLYQKYRDQGLVILGFPANDFGKQEPGTDAEIKQFCTSKFGISFPIFSKISAKGEQMHPLYQYLTSPEENGQFGGPIKWNFNKFLIGKDGKTIARFKSGIEPMGPEIIKAVEEAL
ncbi:MAG: SMP-30/gluconolactonase/LRE family protein [Planctomycetota bacterium]|jgi:gluconolactonase